MDNNIYYWIVRIKSDYGIAKNNDKQEIKFIATESHLYLWKICCVLIVLKSFNVQKYAIKSVLVCNECGVG